MRGTLGAAWMILDVLRQMDQEAVPRHDGTPTGLSWYGGWAKPVLKRPQTEPCWSKRIAEMLVERGMDARSEVPYPDPLVGKRCDVVVDIPGEGRLWLEIKGAWKSWWVRRGSDYIYRSYLLHPLVEGLDPKTHTVPLDLQKLDHLGRPDANSVGALLVGFDSVEHPMDEDVGSLAHLAGLNRWPWS
ncbi:MAG: hypothetical protein KC766_30775, partial [Myxococcales bacterium]|nr:hypothetical protein [Myxococcales bacterium]